MNLERKTVLIQIANDRLRDANVLLRQKRYNGAVYLGGYVIECLLKAAICVHLNRDNLPVNYQTHDLAELMNHSGLFSLLQANQTLRRSFSMVKSWNVGIRYRGRRFKPVETQQFIAAVKEVRQWILRRISP